jgi:hypothetical protein
VSMRQPRLRYLAAVLCIGLGLLAKEVAALGLIPMLFLADLIPRATCPTRWLHRLRRAALRCAPVLALGLIAISVFAGDLRRYFRDETIHYETIGFLSNYDAVVATSAAAVPDVLRLMFFPRTLSIDYPVRLQRTLLDPRARVGAAIVMCWVAGTIVLARTTPVVAFAMAWTAVTYLPCSNIVPLSTFFVAERYLYVPSFGACLLVALAFEHAFVMAAHQRRRWLRLAPTGVAIALICAASIRSGLRNRDWKDSISLGLSALRAGCDTPRLHDSLGKAFAEAGRYDEAAYHYRTASQQDGPNPHSMVNLAVILEKQGQHEEAISWCEKVLATPEYNPQYREYHALARRVLDRARASQGPR